MIEVGDKIPNIRMKWLGRTGLEDLMIGEYLKGKKVVMFATPGAFTPACDQKHLPGYVRSADKIKAQGVNEIICVSVNDPFVMKVWGETLGATGKITMLPDGNGEFVEALGLTFDGRGSGLGRRARRFSMIIEDGIVKSLDVEAAPGEVKLSSAEVCMVRLADAA